MARKLIFTDIITFCQRPTFINMETDKIANQYHDQYRHDEHGTISMESTP